MDGDSSVDLTKSKSVFFFFLASQRQLFCTSCSFNRLRAYRVASNLMQRLGVSAMVSVFHQESHIVGQNKTSQKLQHLPLFVNHLLFSFFIYFLIDNFNSCEIRNLNLNWEI